MRKILLAGAFGAALAGTLWGQADEGAARLKSVVEVQASTRPELKSRFIETATLPVFAGSGPFTKGNNLQASLAAGVTPVTLNLGADFTLTPIAFLQLKAGGLFGSGWNIFGWNGMGITSADGNNKRIVTGDPFGGLVWNAYGGATLQFDLGAVIPGDWNHIVFQGYGEMRYKAYTQAGGNDSWVYENDDGDNFNGWVNYESLILGYQMPLSPVLDTVALMAEMTKTLYDTTMLYNGHDGNWWGENRPQWVFSAVFKWRLARNISLMTLLQMRTRRNYGTGDLDNKEKYYFRTEPNPLDPDRPEQIIFYRLAAVVSFQIK